MSDAALLSQLRGTVSRRACFSCEYCRSQEAYSPDIFSLEHILPRSRGGATTLDNLALSCQGCNGHKATRIEATDPETGGTVALFHPRQHRWSDHFEWSADSTQALGKTPTGRATIGALRLNRQSVVNLRWALAQLGLHPPTEATPE